MEWEGEFASQLSKMLVAWLQMLADHGWHVPLDECVWATTAADRDLGSVKVHNVEVKRSPRAVGFKALGVRFTFDGRESTELKERLRKTWFGFHEHEDLCCRDAPHEETSATPRLTKFCSGLMVPGISADETHRN